METLHISYRNDTGPFSRPRSAHALRLRADAVHHAGDVRAGQQVAVVIRELCVTGRAGGMVWTDHASYVYGAVEGSEPLDCSGDPLVDGGRVADVNGGGHDARFWSPGGAGASAGTGTGTGTGASIGEDAGGLDLPLGLGKRGGRDVSDRDVGAAGVEGFGYSEAETTSAHQGEDFTVKGVHLANLWAR